MIKLGLLSIVMLYSTNAIAATDHKKQINCLAKNITAESEGEPTKGKKAVALVTFNRLKSGKYGKTICEIVYAKNQFSCTKKRKRINVPDDIYQLATDIYNNINNITDITHGAINFHNTKVNPKWRGFKKTIKIGNHIFYKKL